MTDNNEEPDKKTEGDESKEIIEKMVAELIEQVFEDASFTSLVQDDQEKPIADEE
jgi:hypothetical protein